MAGVRVPQLSAIYNVYEVAKKHNVTVIADGGIKLTFDAGTRGEKDYSVQLYHAEMPFFKGKRYKISFDIWGEDDGFYFREVCIDAPNAGWSRYWQRSVAVTKERQTITAEFDYTKKDDPGARFEFNLGNHSSTGTIYISNVRVEIIE